MAIRCRYVIVTAALLVVACKRAPRIGEPCNGEPVQCVSADVVAICHEGKWRRMPCKDTCDTSTDKLESGVPCARAESVEAGDACMYPFARGMPRDSDDVACSRDGRALLGCPTPSSPRHGSVGLWSVTASCAPHEKCARTGASVSCVPE